MKFDSEACNCQIGHSCHYCGCFTSLNFQTSPLQNKSILSTERGGYIKTASCFITVSHVWVNMVKFMKATTCAYSTCITVLRLNSAKFVNCNFHVLKLKYGPRSCQGLGLLDGEGVERLWSYLRPFSNITKEMKPANRQDLLTHALIHYGVKQTNRMGKCFPYYLYRKLYVAF